MCIDFQRFCTTSPNLWRTTRSSCSSVSMLATTSEYPTYDGVSNLSSNCIFLDGLRGSYFVMQSSPRIEPQSGFGITHNFETLSALFHQTHQITMKLHVEICHVSPTLPVSNLSDVKLRNRLIVSVLCPIQGRSCLTEAPRSLNTKLVPPIWPSFLITPQTFVFVLKSRASYVVLATCAAPRWVRVSLSACPDSVDTFVAGSPTAD